MLPPLETVSWSKKVFCWDAPLMATRPSSHEVTCRWLSPSHSRSRPRSPSRCSGRFVLEGADYVAEGHVGEPSRTVVGGLARPHPVARDAWVTFGAAGALARVIPRGEESASGADRNVRLPLRTGRGIGVQFERRAKGHTAIGGANVKDVARIGTGAVLGIDQVNNAVEGGRFTPSLVPPEATLVR